MKEFRISINLDREVRIADKILAWAIVTTPQANGDYQDLPEDLLAAKRACELDLDNYAFLNTLGVALYRNGDWRKAIDALQDSVDLGADVPHNWLFIAMAKWQQGNRESARSLLAKSIAWREKNKPDDELKRFFAEAEKLIEPIGK